MEEHIVGAQSPDPQFLNVGGKIVTNKFVYRFVAIASIAVFALVCIVEGKVLPSPSPVPRIAHYLPLLNAILNGTCSVLLVLSLYFIKKRNVGMHKRLNVVALVLSTVFLLSYVAFHWLAPETLYGDVNGDGKVSAAEAALAGPVRYVYFAILGTHILLAAVALPLVLLSFHRGLQMAVEKHRKLARWTFPIWLYVTVTGVIVYYMISPYYHF
jgi:putative membrane protein